MTGACHLLEARPPRSTCAAPALGGHDVLHVEDLPPPGAPDAAIRRLARDSGRAIVSKEDLTRRRPAAPRGPPVGWTRPGDCSNNALRAELLPLRPRARDALTRGERTVEII